VKSDTVPAILEAFTVLRVSRTLGAFA
jgi:hypothetical protein